MSLSTSGEHGGQCVYSAPVQVEMRQVGELVRCIEGGDAGHVDDFVRARGRRIECACRDYDGSRRL